MLILLMTALTFIIVTSLEQRSPKKEYIWIEAENADTIEHPMEICEYSKNVSNGKYIKIEEGSRGEKLYGTVGKCVYIVNISKSDKYVLWGRVKWNDGCGNSFLFEIKDIIEKQLLGQDGIYEQWHWVRKELPVVLEKGKCEIVLRGIEDGVSLDKILLTNNPDYTPQDSSDKDIYFAANFYVGYEACIDEWIPINGDWHMTRNLESSWAYGVCGDGESRSIAGESWWSNYSFQCAVKTVKRAGVGICFYYQDDDNYYLFRMAGKNSGKDYAEKKQLIKVIDGQEYLLREDLGVCLDNQWYVLKAQIYDNDIKTYIDNNLAFEVYDSSLGAGKIGLYVDPNENTSIDDQGIKILPNESQEIYKINLAPQIGMNGIGVAFGCRNKNNYLLVKWNGQTVNKKDANKIQLIRIINGEKKILSEVIANPLKIGMNYNFEVRKKDDEIGCFINGKYIFKITGIDYVKENVGLFLGRDMDDVCFDDVEVKSIEEFFPVSSDTIDSIPEYFYDFLKNSSVATELSHWRIASGSWDVDVFSNSLVGQKDSEEDAVIWNKNEFYHKDIIIDCVVRRTMEGVGFKIIICNNNVDEERYVFLWDFNSNLETVVLQRNGKNIARNTYSGILSEKQIFLRIRKNERILSVEIDGKEVLRYFDEYPLEGGRIGIGITGNIEKPVFIENIHIKCR
jgi:hypothetical protein